MTLFSDVPLILQGSFETSQGLVKLMFYQACAFLPSA